MEGRRATHCLDLSHAIAPGMPVWPGTPPPRFEEIVTIETDGYREAMLHCSSHTGTHVDLPAHVLCGGAGVGEFGVDHFAGSGRLLDLGASAPPLIAEADLAPLLSLPCRSGYVLLRTGWSRYWGEPGYFDGFPALSPEAASLLASLGLKGIGIDAPSVDPADSQDLVAHRILLGAGLVIVENLRGLEVLPESGFLFCAFPLRLPQGDASPVRAVAIMD